MVGVGYAKHSSVRQGLPEDVPQILVLCEDFYRRSFYAGKAAFDNLKVYEFLMDVTQCDQSNATVFVTELKDIDLHYNYLTGMLIAYASELPFSSEKVATEVAWWVDPQYRNTRIGLELLSAYEAWAELNNYRAVQTALLSHLKGSESLPRIYARRGYTKTEESFIQFKD
jgi:GNAT superfamily N-acetyltransferase